MAVPTLNRRAQKFSIFALLTTGVKVVKSSIPSRHSHFAMVHPHSRQVHNQRGAFFGSGSDAMNDEFACNTILGLIPDYAGKTSSSKPPSILYLGTPTYDLEGPRQRQTSRFSELGCHISTIHISGDESTWSPSNPQTRAKMVKESDVIVVSGGNTLYAIDQMNESGVSDLLQDAALSGTVLTGGSAGAICWFDGGHSDSMDPDTFKEQMLRAAQQQDDTKGGDESGPDFTIGKDEAKPWEYVRVPGLGFLPGLICPHYDKVQSNGVLRSTDFNGMMLRHFGEIGIGIDHWAGLIIEDEEYRVVSFPDKPGSVLADGSYSSDREGVPGVWRLEVLSTEEDKDGGEVQRSVVPAVGKVADLLREATDIVPDVRCDAIRAANPR